MSGIREKIINSATESRRTFGSGLEAVLSVANSSVEQTNLNLKQQELKQAMVQQIVPGRFQPRRDFNEDALRELSNSIAAQGILQPIVVRQYGNGYEIIAGERRWRAAQMAGLQQIPVIVCNISDESALAFGLIENIQRQDLNPIEEAAALKRLIEEFKMTHDQVASSIGRSRAMVSNTLRLLNLTPSVQRLLISRKLDVGHAKVLLVFTADEQEKMAMTIIDKQMTVRAAEKLAQSKRSGIKNDEKITRAHPKCEEWGRALTEKLSSKTTVNLAESGVGKIIIHVESPEEVDWLIDNL